MGLFDKLKDISDVASTVSGTAKGLGIDLPGFGKSEPKEDKSASATPAPIPTTTAVTYVEAESGMRVPSEINSLEEMQDFLTNAEQNASSSIQSMLQVQLTVVKYIQSPTLVDSSIDTMIYALKETLDDLDDEREKKQMRQLFHRMLANYIFFMDARLKVEIEGNKQAGMQLLADAGGALSKTVVSVAAVAATGPIGAAAVSKMVVKNVFGGGQKSLFPRTVKWFGAKQRIAEKTQDFYASLMTIIKKLDKYHPVIGKTMLLSGAIERYANAISDHLMGPDINAAQKEINRLTYALNGKVNLNSMLNGLKSTAFSFITSDMPMGPLKRYNDAIAALEEAKLVQDENASRLINLSKNKDLERVRQCQEDVDTARKEVEAQIAKAQAQLDEATRRKEEYVKTIMDVASKYDEI